MVAFDRSMRFGESQMLNGHTVVFDQWVFFQPAYRGLVDRGVDCGPVILCSFDEDRDHCRSDFPPAPLRSVVEKSAIAPGGRDQLNIDKSTQVHIQAARVLKKQFRMRLACDQTTGLFFIEILRQAAPHLLHRALNIRPPDHHGKVTHVGGVLLLEMDL
jgi:hypothetical protein